MEIIQNLHNKKSKKNLNIKVSALLVLMFYSCVLFSQDNTVLQNTISEKNHLEFQEFFFKAVTEKAINNYQKAIHNLEECNTLLPNNKAVLFELSKNYLSLNKTQEALEYINEALLIEPNNIWLLEHLVAIHKKTKNYSSAIDVQEQIAKNYPKKKQEIVYLHLRNNDNKAAIKLLNELAEKKMLDSRLRRIRENLTKPKKNKTTVTSHEVKGTLKEAFSKEKSFSTLQKLLKQLDTENNTELLNYSNEGMRLFPAQPLVYLMHGKALNKNKNHKKAVKSLQNGIDFVIDDVQMEKRFYTELLTSYKALGDQKNINKYQQKI